MKQKSRTEYSVMNTTVALIAQTMAILIGFFTRVVFTRMLSQGYVGINGLFTDILKYFIIIGIGSWNCDHICIVWTDCKKRYKKISRY